jgi:uncharacterized phage protein gp47/JayE
MPWPRETLSDSRSRILANIATRMPGSAPRQRGTVENVLGTVLAGLQDARLGYLDWQSKEAVPYTSDGEYLVGWGALRGVLLEGSQPAAGLVAVSGTPGKPITTPASFIRSDGAIFTLNAGATIGGGGTVDVSVTAQAVGSVGNCLSGTPLTLTSPQDGINLSAVVETDGLSGGTDLETTDHLRTRVNEIWANPPQGGDLADYVQWTRDNVPAVTRCWSAGPAVMGAGTVVVYFCIDDNVHANGIPSGSNGVSQFEPRAAVASGDQLTVADALYALRSVTALVYAIAPTAVPLNISLAEVPADAVIRAGITAAIQGFFLREASPCGVQLIRQLADGTLSIEAGGALLLSHLEDAISAVPGLDHFVLASPTADVVLSVNGQLSTPGLVSFL